MQVVKELLIRGKKQGYLTYEEITEILPEHFFSAEHINKTLMLFKDNGIKIVENFSIDISEEFNKTLKSIIKLSKYEINLLINLMKALADITKFGNSKGYVIRDDLDDSNYYKYYPDFINGVLKKLSIKKLSKKSAEEFEEARIVDSVAHNLPENDQKILQHLIIVGKSRGHITYQEIKDIFPSDISCKLNIMFEKLGIKIIHNES